MKRRLLGIAQAVLIALVILAGAIAVPILCRPFFYLHIRPLNLGAMVDLTTQQVKTAYNEMMDYCVGLSPTFSAGALHFSESGASHFTDVQKLFILDFRVLLVAGVLLTVVLVLSRKKPVQLLGHTPGFWSAVGLGTTFALVGGIAALDFDKAFEVFHRLFFPGKSNWLFDSKADPVINILPAEFFRNCAILILAVILLSCIGLLLWDRYMRRRK